MADICEFTAGLNLETYRMDSMCRAALERKFEVIGEDCTNLRDQFPKPFSRLKEGAQIIGFRNRLIHGYDNVDDAIVWDVVSGKLPLLSNEIEALLR